MTAGFPGRWGGVQLLAESYPLAALTLVMGVALNSAAAFRWLRWLLGRAASAPPTMALLRRERMLHVGGIVLCLMLGLFPQLLYPWVVQTVTGLSNLF